MKLISILSVVLFATVSYTWGAEFESNTESGFVGVSEKKPIDNPFDNIFHVEINQELCGDEEVWLSYDISGLSDHYSVSRSINDQIAAGGRRIQYSTGWSNQKEQISPEWLKEGDNIVRFTLPETASYGYEVRNIRLEVSKNKNKDSYLHISDPKLYQDGKAYVKGFFLGQAVIKIDGKSIETFNGQFEAIVTTKEFVSVEALFENGSQFCESIGLNNAERIDNEFYYPTGVTKVEHFFKSFEKGSISNTRAVLEMSEGALKNSQFLSINTLRSVDIPALDAGMVNVTSEYAGYRFLPHGTSFDKESIIKLPYDSTKIPNGYTVTDIKTYFFDEQSHHWVPLPTDSVLTESAEVWSKTTHFTDMINGIIQVPESPEVNAYNSTSMKGIKAANPTAAINLMPPPSANSMGNANMSYPLNIPAGRNGMQPQLALSYSNGGGNSWMGLGWNMSMPSIGIDTRWGVPRYSPEKETETYSLNGQQLSPVAHRSEPENRTDDKVFHPRVESSFQKIIRRGFDPKSYWWEVTDKSGTVYTYGKDDEAVLTDEAGHRAFWSLQEVKNLNGNSVKYEYEKAVDSGTGDGNGSVKGYELYCSKITYTNSSGQVGKYSIHFLRNTDGERRPDVSIDGRLGFKRVTADRLTKVEVKYNNQNIRHYEFKYVTGAFYKSLLNTIEEFDAGGALFTTHELEYYDDVKSEQGYQPFMNTETWNPGSQQIKGDFINPIEYYDDKVSAIGGNKGKDNSKGISVVVGFNPKVWDKSISVGGGFNHSTSESSGLLIMMDINGDGLPDEVYMDGSELKYNLNSSGAESGSVQFESPRIANVPNSFENYHVEKSKTRSYSVEAYPSPAFLGYGYSNSESVTKTYFSEVNGDQLPDLVINGVVYFNIYDPETKMVSFSENSGETLSPILGNGNIADGLFPSDEEKIAKAKEENPLHDMIRVWRVPYNGNIRIEGNVQLINPDIIPKNADGVKVSIQKNGNIPLWVQRITENDFSSHTPGGVASIEVSKGDRIYFRLQSIDNGEADSVEWSPIITYNDKNVQEQDANGLSFYQYSAKDDYVLTAMQEVSAPFSGTVKLEGDFHKPKTTDDIWVKVLRITSDNQTIVEMEEFYPWNEEFIIESPTNINWSDIQWTPLIYYNSSSDSNIQDVFNEEGNPIYTFNPVPDLSLYSQELFKSSYYSPKAETDTLVIFPEILVKPSSWIDGLLDTESLGYVTLSVKQKNKLLKRDSLILYKESIFPNDSIRIPISGMDSVIIEYHINDDKSLNRTPLEILLSKVTVKTDSTSELIDVGLYRRYYKEEDVTYGPLYRHWGQFAYNGNGDKGDNPIDESLLFLSEEMKNSGDPNSLPQDNGNSLKDENIYDPSKEQFIVLTPFGNRGIYNGFDNETYLNGDIMSSARLGDDDISELDIESDESVGVVTVNKISRSTSNSYTVGASIISGGITDSESNVLLDYMDMNGDRYPDIVTPNKFQYTNSTGSFAESVVHNFGENHQSKSIAITSSASGSFPVSKSSPITTNIKKNVVNIGNGNSGLGVSISGGTGDNSVNFTWMDINGDGLPDRVNRDESGKLIVSLNLGYEFSEFEEWGTAHVQKGSSTNSSAGLGVTLFHGSISAGIGMSRSDNEMDEVLQDMNGDGLQDRVVMTGSSLQVFLNYGGGFVSDPITWSGAQHIHESSGSSESVNAAFTAGIYIPLINIKICVNPKVSFGRNVNRDLKRFNDVDGDGYLDFLISDNSNNLQVKRSAIGKTNMLKTVNRPLGAAFNIDYARRGNTFNQPNSIWTLSSVEIYDGYAGDGVDTMRTEYAYENGYYDRHEREFYGFDKVISNTVNTENGAGTPYTIVTQNFSNSTYYNKGLMLTESMTDGEGNKFVEKENTYKLKGLEGNFLDDDFNSDVAVAFPVMIATVQKFFEGQEDFGKSTRTEYEYNAIGNVTQYTDFGDEGTDDDLIATIKYHDYDGPYIKGTPSEIVVESMEGALRKRQADIDPATGNVSQIRKYLEDESMAVHDIMYDSYGNLIKMTRPANANEERLSIDYEYDNEVYQFVTKVSNSYGYSSEATYDFAFGQVLESIDLNGNKITYELDDLGRVIKIVGPYEQQGAPYTIKFEYHPEATVPWALTKHYDSHNKGNDLETAIFVDGLGRVLQTKKDGAIYQGEGKMDEEMMIVSGGAIFDAFGRTIEAYYPTLEATGNQGNLNIVVDTDYITTTSYDVLNRARTVTLPDGAMTSTTYGFGSDREGNDQFRTRTTDANGISTEQFTDVRGRVTSVKNITSDGDVWTSFTYNAINEQISATDDMDNSTISEYDWFGRRVLRNHPDAGITNYTYDMAGNLTELVTANLASAGGAITYTYQFERLTDITYPENIENNVHYTYGDAGAEYNRAGRIVIQEDATGAQEFFYGPLGEVIKNVRTVVIPKFDEQTYVTEWTYDTWNRLEAMIYADGEEVTYHYNTGGLLKSMEGKKKNEQFNYVNQLGYDKFEQRVYLEYGNGTKTNYTYEADRRRLKTMTAATSAKRNFMDNVYEYDQVNNILGLKNNAQVPEPNLMGGSSEYSYEYDDLYRLVKAEGKYTGTGDNADHAYSLEMSYNTVGGITQKNQLHTNKEQEQKKTTYNMAYTYGDDQPHAPTHIGQQAYSYDVNGNQKGWTHDVSGQRRELLWDEENRIRMISDNGADHHYVYDASGTRVLKAKGTGQSIYINGKKAAGSGNMGNYTVYVNPYLVLKSGGYTKHYYIEGQRIVSKLGGGFDNNGQGPLKAGNDKINYNTKHQELFDGIVRNQKFLAPDGTILTAGKSGKIPPGQILGDSPKNAEQFQYFYHPDHLGSTSYITDAAGEVYQHLEYFAFGETFVEEHSNTDRTPYLFNGKELDEETGLYYYGARYYEAQTSIWLSVDPLAEKYPSMSPYVYVGNNPILYVDPDGRRLKIAGSAAYQKSALVALQKLTNDKLGMRKDGTVIVISLGTENKGQSFGYGTSLIRSLNKKDKGAHTHTIKSTAKGNQTLILDPKGASTKGKGSDTEIGFNDKKTTGGFDTKGSNIRPPEVGLAHELIHAGHANSGTRNTKKDPMKTDPDSGKKGVLSMEEIQARKEENIIRKERGLTPRKTPK